MLASDLTRAQSVSYERVHRLDQLSSFIPANLFESKSLTLKAAGRHRLTGIKVHIDPRWPKTEMFAGSQASLLGRWKAATHQDRRCVPAYKGSAWTIKRPMDVFSTPLAF